MKFKLDENLSPSLAGLFGAAHDVHSVTDEGLNGQPDERIVDVCSRELRVLITLDLDFANIVTYPPAQSQGIVVLRLVNQAHSAVEAAIQRVLALIPGEPLVGTLWIVEEHRIRING